MMIAFLIIVSLSFLPNLIHSSVPFVLNPACAVPQCAQTSQPALYYANQVIGERKNHLIYSSFDDLTIMIIQTGKSDSLTFNYSEIYAKNYSNAFQLVGTGPVNSLTLILRRLIEFNDTDNTAMMKENSNTINSYLLRNLTLSNITLDKNTNQPSFEYQLAQLNGSVKIDIVYPGAAIRDTKFPKLRTESSSYFLNVALKATNMSFSGSRFAFELYAISPGILDFSLSSSRYIDDQYTPGIFNVSQMKGSSTSSPPASMLWKPVVYQSEARSIEDNTLMQVYRIKNRLTLNAITDQGIFNSLFLQANVSAFNVSLGAKADGFFKKTNYGFIQFTAGLDVLKPDSTAGFVSVALIITLALPVIVAIIAVIFMLKRRLSKQSPSSYRVIQD